MGQMRRREQKARAGKEDGQKGRGVDQMEEGREKRTEWVSEGVSEGG